MSGRPTDFNDEMCLKALEYLYSCNDKYDEALKVWDVKLPTIEGLAVYLNINRSTIYEWKGVFPQFSDILDKIMAEQANRIISRGLAGVYNSTISKLMLTKHGYHDKTDTDVTTGGEKIGGFNFQSATLPPPVVQSGNDIGVQDMQEGV
jgi:hypothetical protein